MQVEPGEITRLLRRWREGDSEAESRLFELVLPDLRRLADRYLRLERPGHILQPSAVVNEAYLRLQKGAKSVDWRDRAHFFAIAARCMRRYLIDTQGRRKAPPLVPEDLRPESADKLDQMELALEIDRLLDELQQRNGEWCSAVELKYFLGLTDEEAADALQISKRTFQRRWEEARKWLFQRMGGGSWKAQSATNSS